MYINNNTEVQYSEQEIIIGKLEKKLKLILIRR